MSCKGCEKRYIGCHSECEDYIQETKELKERNEKIKAERLKYCTALGQEYKRIARARKRKGK